MTTPVVLLVDDEPLVTAGLKRQMRDSGFRVLEASSAEQALRIVRSTPVDVIVADEQMPGVPGSELVAVVFREFPQVIRIILSGHASLDAAIRAINEGQIYRFLTKPCHAIDLVATIRKALDHRDTLIENRRLNDIVTEQAVLLRQLEREHPGIGVVRRDESDAVILDELDAKLGDPCPS